MTCLLPFSAQPGPVNAYVEANTEVVLSVNWSPVIGTATVSTSSWSLRPDDGGATLSGAALATPVASVEFSSTTPGQLYEVTNTVTTSAGETLKQAFQVYVRATPTIFIYT